MRPTRKQVALSLLANAPEGAVLPSWVQKNANRHTPEHRKKDEEALHLAVAQLLDLQPGILWWHSNNSMHVGPMTGAKMGYLAKLKRMGVKRGVSDLTIVMKGSRPGEVRLLLIELKSPSGVVSDEQRDFMNTAQALGAKAVVCRSIQEVVDVLRAVNPTS